MADNETAQAAFVHKDNAALLTWTATVLASFYFVWLASSFYYSSSAFMNMYASMGVELPLQTRILISFRWFYLLLYVGAIAVVVTKQHYVRERWRNLAITFAVTVVAQVFSNLTISALYLPLSQYMEKLGK